MCTITLYLFREPVFLIHLSKTVMSCLLLKVTVDIPRNAQVTATHPTLIRHKSRLEYRKIIKAMWRKGYKRTASIMSFNRYVAIKIAVL